MPSYDFIGSIAIVKFNGEKRGEKIKFARELLKKKNIKTVLEKSERVKGRLRTIKTNYLAGENTKEALYKENGCLFRLNIDTCYFSSRLSEERKQVASKINKSDRVLVMFAGVGPFSIIIGKLARPKEVVSVELGRECSKYAQQNVKLNKLNNVKVIQGDVKKVIKKEIGKFDAIVMPRPNLKETFLEQAFLAAKKGTRIYYYFFCNEKELEQNIEKIRQEAKKNKAKIKILNVKRAGDIAPYKYRYRADIKVT